MYIYVYGYTCIYRREKMETTTVRLQIPIWREINALRQSPSETPNDVIARLIQTSKQSQEESPSPGHESRSGGDFLPTPALPGA